MIFDLDVIRLTLQDGDQGAARFDEAGVLVDQTLYGIMMHLNSGRTEKARELLPIYKAALARLLIVNASLGVAHGISQGKKYVAMMVKQDEAQREEVSEEVVPKKREMH